jgi:hypothetical protein
VETFAQFPYIEGIFDTDSGPKRKANSRQRGNIWLRGIGMVFPHNHWKGNNDRTAGGADPLRFDLCWGNASDVPRGVTAT